MQTHKRNDVDQLFSVIVAFKFHFGKMYIATLKLRLRPLKLIIKFIFMFILIFIYVCYILCGLNGIGGKLTSIDGYIQDANNVSVGYSGIINHTQSSNIPYITSDSAFVCIGWGNTSEKIQIAGRNNKFFIHTGLYGSWTGWSGISVDYPTLVLQTH